MSDDATLGDPLESVVAVADASALLDIEDELHNLEVCLPN